MHLPLQSEGALRRPKISRSIHVAEISLLWPLASYVAQKSPPQVPFHKYLIFFLIWPIFKIFKFTPRGDLNRNLDPEGWCVTCCAELTRLAAMSHGAEVIATRQWAWWCVSVAEPPNLMPPRSACLLLDTRHSREDTKLRSSIGHTPRKNQKIHIFTSGSQMREESLHHY